MKDQKPVDRKLAAILAADIVGYSRLMGVDEVGTLRALKAHRKELIDPAIAGHRGRIVKTTGDGILVEFGSAVDAVACGVALQRDMASSNSSVPEDKRLVLRVGINVGDIIIDANDIFGDGVNVAARLETLCEPGGLCISRAVRDQVRDKLPLVFSDLGEQSVKNIARPVRAFGLAPEAIAAAPELSMGRLARPERRWRAGIAATVAVVAITAGGAAWWVVRSPATPPSQTVSSPPASVLRDAASPSIAVLPLLSLTEADKSDYFADGLTEDIIAALGRFSELSVSSRSAVLAYKGKSPTPEEVGRALNVRYIVEGSVRRSPERIRVSISLTDTSRGALLWSHQYDAEPQDIFAVQDDITRRIAGALAVRLTSLELTRAAAKSPSNLEAYDLVLRGRDLLSRLTRSGNAQARTFFQRAIELDPNLVSAYVGLGGVDVNAVTQGWTADPGETLQRAENFGRKAVELDDLNAGAHALLGRVYVRFGDYDRALDELKRAIELNASDADSYGGLCGVLLWRGDIEGAIKAGEILVQFQPNLSVTEAFTLGTTYVLADRDSDAIRLLERSLDRNRTSRYTNLMLAAAYAQAGRHAEAQRQAETVRQLFPGFSREEFGSLLRNPAHREKLAAALQKAGL